MSKWWQKQTSLLNSIGIYYFNMLLMDFTRIRYNTAKKPKKKLETIIALSLPNFIFSNGYIGVSII